jgi:hypothetical protein
MTLLSFLLSGSNTGNAESKAEVVSLEVAITYRLLFIVIL